MPSTILAVTKRGGYTGRVTSPQHAHAGPFAALVAAARVDADAAEGLAAAYAAMDADARRRLLQAIRQDAGREGISAAPALAALMAVEGDAGLATVIFDALSESAQTDLSARARPCAGCAGGPHRGRAYFARPLYGDFMDLVYVSWAGGAIERARFVPLLHAAHLETTVESLRGDDEPLLRCSEAAARDRIVEALWHHRRHHGRLPAGTEAIGRAL